MATSHQHDTVRHGFVSRDSSRDQLPHQHVIALLAHTASQEDVNVSISGGTGDADLYINRNRPGAGDGTGCGSAESCDVSVGNNAMLLLPGAAHVSEWYVTVGCYAA